MFQDGSGETRLLLSAVWSPGYGKPSPEMTGHGRVDRLATPDERSKGGPLRLSLPTTLLTASQPVAESYRALHLQPPCEMLRSRRSCYGSPGNSESPDKKSGKQDASTFEGSPV